MTPRDNILKHLQEEEQKGKVTIDLSNFPKVLNMEFAEFDKLLKQLQKENLVCNYTVTNSDIGLHPISVTRDEFNQVKNIDYSSGFKKEISVQLTTDGANYKIAN